MLKLGDLLGEIQECFSKESEARRSRFLFDIQMNLLNIDFGRES